MKFRALLIALCSTAFVVSCAHKNKLDEGETQTKTTTKKEAAKTIVHGDQGYECLVAGDKRIVTLDKKEKRCEVHYTKFGKKEQMAWGETNPKICDDVYNNIRSNIEKRGFKCTTFNDPEKKKERQTASNK